MDTQTYNNLQSGNYAKLVQQNKELQEELQLKNKMIELMAETLCFFSYITKLKKECIEKYKKLAQIELKKANKWVDL